MNSYKVFATRNVPQKGLEMLKEAGIKVTVWKKKENLAQNDLIEKLRGYDALLSIGPNKIDKTFLEACGHLKVIALLSVGFDNVDVKYAKKTGIPIGNTPDVLSEATADIAFLLMQMSARKAIAMNSRILNGDWGFFDPTRYLGMDLKGKTLGIYGLGRIGLEMAKKCKAAFGMDIIYFNRHPNAIAEKELNAQKVSFTQLLRHSDVLSVHAPLTDATKNRFGAEEFSKMKNSAIFVNTARGAMVDEIALTKALKTGQIWGAGLDVTNPEPMQPKNPLLKMENVAVLPHIGSATIDTRNAMAVLAAQNIIAGLTGKPIPYSIY